MTGHRGHRSTRRQALSRSAAALPLALLALGGLAHPSSAASSSAALQTTETGELVELVADNFAAGTAGTEWALQRDNRSFVALEGLDAATARGLVGKRVTVRGKALGRHKLDASSVQAATQAGTTSETLAATSGTAQAYDRVGVVMVNFADDTRRPVTADDLRATLGGSSTDVDDHFQDSSEGQLGIHSDVFDWVTVERGSASSCDYSAWGNAARTALTSSGVDLSSYQHVMFFWPQQSACSWAGLGQMPGSTTWINGSNTTRVLAHELSHNLGEHHASSAGSCVEGGVSVVIPASTSDCTVSEYGDAFTIMGSSSFYLHTAASRVHRGWMEATTAAVGADGSWTIAPVDAGSGTRLLRIPRGDGSYLSLEYRQPQGSFDTFSATSPAATGVTIRLDHGVGNRQTVLFDANPATATLGDAPLSAGRSVTDPVSGARITVDSVSGSGAQVSVAYGAGDPTDPTDPSGGTTTDPTPPPGDTTAPTSVTRLKAAVRKGNVTLTWRAASDETSSVEYVVTRDALVATTTATKWADAPGAGNHVYTVVARDAAGNVSAPAQVVVDLTVADSSTSTGNGGGNGGGKGGGKGGGTGNRGGAKH